jgi:hypothetical protein
LLPALHRRAHGLTPTITRATATRGGTTHGVNRLHGVPIRDRPGTYSPNRRRRCFHGVGGIHVVTTDQRPSGRTSHRVSASHRVGGRHGIGECRGVAQRSSSPRSTGRCTSRSRGRV